MAAAALLLGAGARAATAYRRLPRVWARLIMTDQLQQPLLKRQRVAGATATTTCAAGTSSPAAGADGTAQQAAAASGSPTDAQPVKQQQQQQPQQQQGGKKAVVMPTPVYPPTVPTDPAAWENAVLLVDKPQTWTSFDVCGKLRRALAALLRKKDRDVKVGHAGTLDPMATGLLIVCVGRGTKSVDAFMGMRKQYSGTLRLGEGTPSFDADTPVEERAPWEHITDDVLLGARDGLVGDIQQLPPMYSAIKVGGKKLYEAARKGKEVERQARSVTVERFDVWRDEADKQSVHFRVVCSKGTYIRSLAFDLGRALGSAAHLTALRREAIGEYSVEGAWDIQELAQQLYQQRKEAKAASVPAEEADAAAVEAAAPAGGSLAEAAAEAGSNGADGTTATANGAAADEPAGEGAAEAPAPEAAAAALAAEEGA